MSDAAQVRAEIDREVAGQTVCHPLERNAREHGTLPALSVKDASGNWKTRNWAQYRDEVAQVAMGLRELGVGQGDFVGIQARNIPEHLIADLGVVHAQAIPVSMYNTLAPDQIAYIAGHCQAKVAFVENRSFMEKWEKVRTELPQLEKVVMLEDAAEFSDYDWVMSWDDLMASGAKALEGDGRATFEAMWKEVKPEDFATLIYTSGTTGNPKGVILTHYNVLWTTVSLNRIDPDTPHGYRYVSYLPLAHSAERMATHYNGLRHAAHTYFCPEIPQIFEYVPQVHPYSFVGVPRVWEKLQAGIRAKVAMEPDERKRKIGEKALDLALEVETLKGEGKSVPLGKRVQHKLFDRLVYSKIRQALGLDECELPISGSAPIAPEVLRFFWGIGIEVGELYGLTETSAPATAPPKGGLRLGTIGKAMPGVEAKVHDDGELLLRGGNVTQGYYKEPEKTEEALDPEGWLRTGDIVEVDSDGYITIVDRKKELIVTPGGKNISPSNIESLVKMHPLVGQVCVIGDRRKFISALIVLDPEVAPIWAQKAGVEFSDIASFSQNEKVQATIAQAVEDANQHLSQVEKIKKFRILPTEWTAESEELTPSLKLKRRVITEKYADEIDSMYADA